MPKRTPAAGGGRELLLGELEAAIMQIIWQHEEMTVREVWEALQTTRPVAYTTVMTVMSRLVPKGVLVARKQGKTYYYRAANTADQLVQQRAQQAVQEVLANYGDAAIAQFLRELEQADPQYLASLRALVEQERSHAD
jgi:predicted transcriptional regulator